MSDSTEDLVQILCTVRDFIRWGATSFNRAGLWYGHGTDNAWDEATVLVLHALQFNPPVMPEMLDAALTVSEKMDILQLFQRRIEQRLPSAYLTGRAWFANLEFAVDERVLIPRSPLAEIIEVGLQPWVARAPSSVLDLCTGSGCIGIACAYAFPDCLVDLSDISLDALEVARQNVLAHQLDHRVTPVASDLFASLQGRKYDVIIANPPYVDAEDMAEMPPEYLHEPALALASGVDGLDFTLRLLQEAADHLNEQGTLIVEVGNSWISLQEYFPELPFTWVEFERGGHGVFVLTREQLVEHFGSSTAIAAAQGEH